MMIVTLIAMIFCHIIDDFKLQGILASMKQREWWYKEAPNKMYKHDYIVALLEHAFSWTCSIYLPILVYSLVTQSHQPIWIYIVSFVLNWVIHTIIDNLKANAHLINLVEDQTAHIIQIVVTWIICVVI